MTDLSNPTQAANYSALPLTMALRSSWFHALQIVLVVAFLSAAVWVQTFQLIADAKARALVAQQVEIANLGRLSAEHAERTIASVDQTLRIIRNQYLQHQGQFNLANFAAARLFDTNVVVQLGFIDAQGLELR